MKSRISYTIWDRKRSWAEAVRTVQQAVQERGFNPEGEGTVTFLYLGPSKRLTLYSLKESIEILAKVHSFDSMSIETSFRFKPSRKKSGDLETLSFVLSVEPKVEITLGADNYDLVKALHNHFQSELGLHNPPTFPAVRPLNLQPTVFVSRHFDEKGNTAATPLSSFLTLLGLDVLEGAEYASRDIPDKVTERIDRQDIFLLLVTGKRDHAWLNAEPAYAKAKGKHIIILCEDGSSYDPTILGRDLEQIRFPSDRIENTFIPLLREFRSIRVRGL
jgi:hypothetical protein